jgi:hypothetical protein
LGQIGKRLHPFAVHNVCDAPPEEEVHGY